MRSTDGNNVINAWQQCNLELIRCFSAIRLVAEIQVDCNYIISILIINKFAVYIFLSRRAYRVSRIAYHVSRIAYRVYNVRGRNRMPDQKTAREYARAVIKNYANLSPDRRAPYGVFRAYLACISVTENKSETCLHPFPVNFIFLSGYEKEEERMCIIWAAYMTTVTTTRHNSKTTIIKANSKEVVCKKRIVARGQ